MEFRSVLSYLGVILEILGILALVPVVISAIFGENILVPFFITGILSFAIGSVLDKRFEKQELSLGDAMILSIISFVVISLMGSIPYMGYLNPLDSFFESVSGFTTTGLTIIAPEGFPATMLFWRSFTQWVGGLGILVIFLLLAGSPGSSSYYLYKAEGREHRIEASTRHTVKKIFKIYVAYTVIGIALLALVGMPVFDSLLTSFSAISTGSFSIHSASIGFYNSPLIEVVVIILSVLGATSFFLHNNLFRRKFMTYLRNTETKIFWILISVFSVLISISLLGTAEPIRSGIFHTFSALTTSGFSLTQELPGVTKSLIIILMLVGGAAGSTAGGIKLIRAGVILKSLSWMSKKISSPREAIIPFKLGKKVIKEHEITIISLFFSIYLIFLAISTIILSFSGISPLDSLFHAASAQGNVGLSTLNMAEIPALGKIFLIINMILGRLEIFPFLVLIYSIFRIDFIRNKINF